MLEKVLEAERFPSVLRVRALGGRGAGRAFAHGVTRPLRIPAKIEQGAGTSSQRQLRHQPDRLRHRAVLGVRRRPCAVQDRVELSSPSALARVTDAKAL
jgi:hypothetical protein